MKVSISLVLGVSCFALLGNAQDDASTTAAAPLAYTTQGNVSYNRHLHEQELKRAAAEARQMKALKAAMASQSSGQVVYTTAEDFLKANRPPMPPPSDRPEPVRRQAYVPSFEEDSSRSSGPPAVAPVSQEQGLPKKEMNLLGWLKPKKKVDAGLFGPVGASEYQNPYEPDGIAAAEGQEPAPPAPPATTADLGAAQEAAMQEAAMQEATQGIDGRGDNSVGGEQKSGFLGKLFSKKRDESVPSEDTASTPMVAQVDDAIPTGGASAEGATSEAPAVAYDGGLPEPPSYEDAPPAPVAEQAADDSSESPPSPPAPAPIFVKRETASAEGDLATVKREGSATVEGVKVKLYAGSDVRVLNTNGREATVQLPDGRIGTTQKSLLKR